MATEDEVATGRRADNNERPSSAPGPKDLRGHCGIIGGIIGMIIRRVADRPKGEAEGPDRTIPRQDPQREGTLGEDEGDHAHAGRTGGFEIVFGQPERELQRERERGQWGVRAGTRSHAADARPGK